MRGLGPVARAGSALFSTALHARANAYRSGLLRSERVPDIRVISVGNLRVGGTGKTPLTIHLARRLADLGVRVAVVTRGYRGSLERKGGLVSDGRGPLLAPAEAGDEAVLMARRLGGVMIRVGRNRVTQVRRARDAGAEVVLLDDGFQHRRIERDLDIVLVTPADFGDALLPAGSLRETAGALGRADLVGALEGDFAGAPVAPDFVFRYVITGLIPVHDPSTRVPPTACRGAWAYLTAGIARPKRFVATARGAGIGIAGHALFRDHHRLSGQEMASVERAAVAAGADIILMTEKDLARQTWPRFALPAFAFGVDVEMVSGEALLLRRLAAAIRD